MPQGRAHEPGRRNYTPRKKTYTQQAAKDRFIELVQNGMNINPALEKVERSRKTYEDWRANDKEFARRVDQARQLRQVDREVVRGERLPFAEFRKKYLKTETFWHQHQWIDILEGREPRDLHEAQTYVPGKKSRVLINTPPFHAKALALDTVLATPHGWSTIGALRVGDEVFGPDGKPTTVTAKSPVFEKPCFRVVINDGEEFIASEDHLWTVRVPSGWRKEREETLTTRELFEQGGKFKLPAHEALHMEPLVDLPLDPYLLGCWLGDGTTLSGGITTADVDIIDAFEAAGFKVGARASKLGNAATTYNILGLYPILSQLGVRGGKFIPEGYLFGSYEQRLALLQGLLDTDGTINHDGQASFTNMNRDLAEGVLYLASSLGLRPTIKEGRATLNGRDCGPKWTVWFTTGATPCFRLERKLRKQRFLNGEAPGRGLRFRTIVSVEPVETVPTQCITVDNDSHLFLVGKSLVPTHNSVTITIDYVVYRLCMDPSFRVILVSETSTLAEDFLFGIKTRLDHPDYIDLQKAYAPDGGWKATSEQWTGSRIVFGGDQREGGEKDPNVQAIGMGSQIYGRRADLIILDDTVTGKNVREWEKQMKWLRREVSSRLEMGGKLLVVGTRIAPVDLYSQLMNPEHYANGKVPWTHFAAPAILEEGIKPDGTVDPEKHVTLWPWSEQSWQNGDDECDCGTEECREGFVDEDGRRLYPRWDGLHLEIGPRADNNATEWALVYQQRSVAEDATFPEHAIRKSTNGARYCGLLQADRVGHPFGGMHNKYVIAGLDPAIKGYAGIVVLAVDRETQKRYVLNVWNMKAPTGEQLKNKMKEITEEYSVDEWRVEKTGLLQFFSQDTALRHWFTTRGIRFTEHTTGSNKWDPSFGVSSLAPLFGVYDKAWDADSDDPWRVIQEPLVELPRPNLESMKAFIHQLVTWTPDLDPNKIPCDLVMAFWFAEVGAREHLGTGRGPGTITSLAGRNKFISPRSSKSRTTVNLADFRGL